MFKQKLERRGKKMRARKFKVGDKVSYRRKVWTIGRKSMYPYDDSHRYVNLNRDDAKAFVRVSTLKKARVRKA